MKLGRAAISAAFGISLGQRRRARVRAILIIATLLMVTTPSTFAARHPASKPLKVLSPDGSLAIVLELKSKPPPYLPGNRPYYSISYKGAQIVADSPLGLSFLGAPSLDHDFEVAGIDEESHDDMWENPFGARRQVRDHFNQLTVELQERGGPSRQLNLIFRVYNEGVAFRYVIPKQPNLERFTLTSENTGFYFPGPASAFALNQGGFVGPYEGEYRRIKLDEIEPASTICLPLLVEGRNGLWVAITEADLSDYAGAYLGGVPGNAHALTTKLVPLREQTDRVLAASTPKATPWRVVMVNPRPGGLIESSDLILNLSQPNALGDISWIKPGKSAWDWWSGTYAAKVDYSPGMNTATMEHYVDFAADHNLEYMLIDAGWSPQQDITRSVPEVNIPEIIAHASSRKVKVLLWTHWTPTRKQMDLAFPLYEKWGVAGVKVDFLGDDRDDQAIVNLYGEIVRKAAEHHLVVDIHGAYKPTGLRRTYPNLLTREGVMGMEYSKWSYRATPEHDVTIPFTRMLTGPMDYTPGCFNNATRKQFRPQNVQPMCQGTRAHQLAMYVVFLSPLVMLSDYPESYDQKPGMEFLEKVPTVWDDTRVLSGEPAKYVTIARKRGDGWYLGAMTNWDARDLEVSLEFLAGPAGSKGGQAYEAEIFADGSDADQVATSLSIIRKRVTARDKLTFHLAPGGGVAVIFTPIA